MMHPPLSIAEIARMAAKSQPEQWGDEEAPRRMRRYLKSLEEKNHVSLLISSSKKPGVNRSCRVHLSDLQKVCPQLFEPVRSMESDIEETRERQDEIETALNAVARAAGQANTTANRALALAQQRRA